MGSAHKLDDPRFWQAPLEEVINDLYQRNDGYLSTDHVDMMDSAQLADKLADSGSGIIRFVFRGLQVGSQKEPVSVLYLLWYGDVTNPDMLASAPMVDPDQILATSSQTPDSKLVVVRDIRAATDVFRAPPQQLNTMRDYDLWIVNLAHRNTPQKILISKLMLNRVFADARADREVTLASTQELAAFMTENVV